MPRLRKEELQEQPGTAEDLSLAGQCPAAGAQNPPPYKEDPGHERLVAFVYRVWFCAYGYVRLSACHEAKPNALARRGTREGINWYTGREGIGGKFSGTRPDLLAL